MRKFQERKRQRFLATEELARLGAVLERARKDGTESPYAVAAFQSLILTGCRLSEIQRLKWDYVRPGYLNLPDSKTGARRIPLAPAAQANWEGLTRVPGNDLVIASDPRGVIRNLHHPWRRISKQAGLDHVRIHDLRHTYASNAVMQGLNILWSETAWTFSSRDHYAVCPFGR